MPRKRPTTTFRARTHEILEVARPGDRASQVTDWLLITLVVANVVAVMLESIESFSVAHAAALARFEILSVAVFTLEYGVRLWACVESAGAGRAAWRVRLHYCARPMAIVDLLSFLPFYLSALPFDLRSLRVLRLLRALKLTRYSAAMGTLLSVLRQQAPVFGAALFVLAAMLVLASSGIYLVENRAQPDAFGSIPASMWWAVVTLTTVGYGDVTPITPGGKLFAAVISVIGVGMVALPAGILSSGFSAEVRRRQKTFARELGTALDDGVITTTEADSLETLRRRLGLTEEDADSLIQSALAHAPPDAPDSCPHCGKSREL